MHVPAQFSVKQEVFGLLTESMSKGGDRPPAELPYGLGNG